MFLKGLSNTGLTDALLCFTETSAQFPQCHYNNLGFSSAYFLTLGLLSTATSNKMSIYSFSFLF